MIKNLIEDILDADGQYETTLDEVIVAKITEPIARTSAILPPGLCLVGQGEKHIYVGDKTYVYDANTFLLGTINLPIYSELKEASPEKPYYGMAILLNPSIVSDLLIEYEEFDVKAGAPLDGVITMVEATEALVSPIKRLLGIIGNPVDEKILGPNLLREIYYTLLKSENGAFLRNSAFKHGKAHQLAPIVHYLEKHILDDLSIDDLVSRFGMSASALHEHFKRVTSLPPMQYLKRLRLNNAHQLLLVGSAVSEAAINSGYNSVTQFSREFKRQFGMSPSEMKRAS